MISLAITPEHIAKAKPMLEEFSPLGIALKEFFPNSMIHVGLTTAIIDNCILKLSPNLASLLEKYDLEGHIYPLQLELDIKIER